MYIAHIHETMFRCVYLYWSAVYVTMIKTMLFYRQKSANALFDWL